MRRPPFSVDWDNTDGLTVGEGLVLIVFTVGMFGCIFVTMLAVLGAL